MTTSVIINPPAIQDIQAEIIEDFNLLQSWEQKYQYLIELGSELNVFDEVDKIEQNRLKGCQSQVWLLTEAHINEQQRNNPLLHLKATSDAAIVRGLLSLIIKVYNGQSCQTILDTPLDFIKQTALAEYLTPQRKNGLASMLKAIHQQAQQHLQI